MSLVTLQFIILGFRVLSIAALIFVIVIATREAMRLNKNVLLWGFAAAAAYLVPSMLLKQATRFAVDGIEQTPGVLMASVFFYHVVPLIAGLAACYVLKKRALARNSEAPAND